METAQQVFTHRVAGADEDHLLSGTRSVGHGGVERARYQEHIAAGLAEGGDV